ncbi:MAG TPA: hypothetical protein VF494_05370 [Candidatus Limnocylindrales bacterium]
MTYWLIALVLTAFGVVAAFSIGLPFFVVGIAMLALGPLRGHPRLFLPGLLGVIAFVVGASLVAPWTCGGTATAGGDSYTVCRSLVGLTWSGPGLYNPPAEAFGLAVLVGLAAGLLVAILTFASLGRRRGPPPGIV